ncbi:alpha/beta hydrolase [Nonomuraea longispora]|uniref:Alpha/beta hydrolase n=1 Tax=Nonomuraea longispora TaxID=1848320 RepID=A0A4R4N3M9_9ACTN|nr:alpha/beta hydrolase [Nonomuraea longispora]TDC02464.1 alpha/beta hydrolase [Nonomuraea longispora]
MSTHTAWQLRHRVRVTGGEVAVDVFGQGPPAILVHGTPASSFLWREVVPVLAREHAVHVWDLLGYGDSRLAQGAVPSIDRQARTLAELVRHWDLGAPALVGHDIGGATVLRAHLVHGVPARRIALLDAAVLGSWLTPFTRHMRAHADVYRTMPEQVFADIIRPRLGTATHRPMSEAVAGAYLAPWDGAAGQRRWIDQVVAVGDDDTRDLEARLSEITVPTQVLWGEHDRWLPPATAARLAAAIPGARLTMIPEAGHFLPEDNPYDTAQELLRFLGPT